MEKKEQPSPEEILKAVRKEERMVERYERGEALRCATNLHQDDPYHTAEKTLETATSFLGWLRTVDGPMGHS